MCMDKCKCIHETLANSTSFFAGAAPIEFCGHRLHVHRSFKLLMTCCVYPTSSHLLAQVVNLTHFIDSSVSLPLCNELLLPRVHGTVFDSQSLATTCANVLELQENLRSVERRLVDCLSKYSSQECSAWSAESIELLMEKKEQVCCVGHSIITNGLAFLVCEEIFFIRKRYIHVVKDALSL